MKRRYVVVDLETTGNSPKTGERIIQFAAVVIESGKIVHTYTTYINPSKHIPPFITNLTGICDEDVKDAPPFSKVANEIEKLFHNSVFVAHNIHFDYMFLQHEFLEHGLVFPTMATMDTVELSRILFPTLDSYKLNDLAQQFGLYHDRPHQADSDAYVTATLFLTIIEKLKKLPYLTLQGLIRLSAFYKSDIGMLLSSVLNDKLVHNWTDEVAYTEVIGIAIKKLPYILPDELPLLTSQEIYEKVQQACQLKERSGQFEMMTYVEKAFFNNRHVLIEAGTGIGKTLGYLIPAIAYAAKHGKQVLISTYSLHLQHQIVHDAIPQIEYALDKKVNIALLKGRKHYLSIKKFAGTLRQEDRNYDIVLTKSQILVWLTETTTGDVDELNLPSGGKSFWDEVCCSYRDKSHDEGVDFYERAIHQGMIADLIVTNHALLLHDIQREEKLFTGIQTVILDEAHRFIDTATGILGKSFSASYCNQRLMKLVGMIEEYTQGPRGKQLIEEAKEIKLELDDLFRYVFALLQQKHGQQEGATRKNVSLQKVMNEKELNIVQDMLNRLQRLYQRLKKQEEYDWDLPVYMKERAREQMKSFEEQFEVLLEFFVPTNECVRWIEFDSRGTFHSLSFFSQFINIGEILQERFFPTIERLLFTSATLTMNGSFDYFQKECRLESEKCDTYQIPSPFDYQRNVQLYFPTNMPKYKKMTKEDYVKAIQEILTEILFHSNGRTLVLFQSNELLSHVYEQLKHRQELQSTVLLAQTAMGNRNRLIKQFKQFKQVALLGGASFWEGIDFEQANIDSLVMVRLPFSSPDHPYIKKKCETLTEKGESAFYEYTLPQAVLRFKQGFGRLIRSEESQGVMFVLDPRITETSYGHVFLDSIPKTTMKQGTLDICIEEMKSFLGER